MVRLNSRWERVRLLLTPSKVRVGLIMISLVAMVLGGSAQERWD